MYKVVKKMLKKKRNLPWVKEYYKAVGVKVDVTETGYTAQQEKKRVQKWTEINKEVW